MIYCVSDIHGDYRRYRELLDRLSPGAQDTLYVLGDVVDRGPDSMRVLLHMMRCSNIRPLVGNHEYMALRCLRFLTEEITEESLAALTSDRLQEVAIWRSQGGDATLESFRRLPPGARDDVLRYLGEFELYEELETAGQRYVLVHAGLGGFSPDRPLDDYTLPELIWTRTDYSAVCFPDRILVTGHTPTATIPGNPRPHCIYRANNHLAIDCGCGFSGRLGAVCLDTGEEVYV